MQSVSPCSLLFMHRKQRKKLHDRLRQSLRNDRKSMTNGPQIPNTPLENVQLVNVSFSLVRSYLTISANLICVAKAADRRIPWNIPGVFPSLFSSTRQKKQCLRIM